MNFQSLLLPMLFDDNMTLPTITYEAEETLCIPILLSYSERKLIYLLVIQFHTNY